MKTASEVIRLLGVTPTELNNWRRNQHLIADSKASGEWQYSEAEFLILKMALLRLREGVFPRIAFPQAREQYRVQVDRVTEALHDYAQDHPQFGPNVKQLRERLGVDKAELDGVLAAMVEERLLVKHAGLLDLVPVYAQPELRGDTPQAHRAYKMLSPERKRQLRDMALRLYMSATSDLPQQRRIPAPVPPRNDNSVMIVSRNLPRGCFGYNDPDVREITVTTGLVPSKRRFVIMHEYFHILLGHGKKTCKDANENAKEAEATYAAAHYLVPIHTLDLMLPGISGQDQPIHAVAEKYQVSTQVIEFHLKEFPEIRTKLTSCSGK